MCVIHIQSLGSECNSFSYFGVNVTIFLCVECKSETIQHFKTNLNFVANMISYILHDVLIWCYNHFLLSYNFVLFDIFVETVIFFSIL